MAMTGYCNTDNSMVLGGEVPGTYGPEYPESCLDWVDGRWQLVYAPYACRDCEKKVPFVCGYELCLSCAMRYVVEAIPEAEGRELERLVKEYGELMGMVGM